MEIFEHPFLLFVAIILSLFSTIYAWRGFRERDVAAIILGIGLSIPTFSMMDIKFWIAGIVVSFFGWWLKNKLEGV